MKTTAYLVFFFLILVSNIFLTVNIVRGKQARESTVKILDEISHIDKKQSQFEFSSSPLVLGTYEAKASISDGRVANLKAFFRKYNSVLYDYSENIVTVSDKFHFDYRLLPAIAMQESNLCKYIPEDSYNCWGWGIYGDTVTRFDSYDEAIDVVAQGIKTHYIDKGLVTASSIMQKYTPSSNGSWAYGVNTFLQVLE